MSWFTKKPKTDNATDEELLELYQSSGDLNNLAGLFERYVPLVYGVCLKYLKNEEQSKDGVMQVFEQLTQKVAGTEIRNFKSWLYVVTRNHCLSQLRTGYKIKLEDLDNNLPVAADDPANEDKEHYLQMLERCIDLLGDKQQHCVRMFYLSEKSYQEIADESGYTLNEVKSYIQNGKRNLKICLQNNREK